MGTYSAEVVRRTYGTQLAFLNGGLGRILEGRRSFDLLPLEISTSIAGCDEDPRVVAQPLGLA